MCPSALRIQELSKKFGQLTAVDQLTITIRQGEILALLGPNGAGKTTTIGMICGLIRPDRGRVYLEDQPIEKVRQWIGICPQETILWGKLTCIEQIEYLGQMYDLPRRLAHKRGTELLDALGLSEKTNQTADKLSGGMRRRLNLVLALIHDPELLILDEPEAGLDPQSRLLVREYIRSQAGQKTILLTTHNMDEADRLADRIAIIDHGVLLQVGTSEEIKSSVGEGELLELNFLRQPDDLCPIMTQYGLNCFVKDRSLFLGGSQLMDRLPDLLTVIRSAGFVPENIHTRTRTLEDAFIALTGRQLRE